MYNYEKLKTMSKHDMMLLFHKAEVTKGSEGRKLRKHLSWLVEERW